MNSTTVETQLFSGDYLSANIDLPHGTVCIRTQRCPGKLTPNEDAAAVLPVDEHSLVIAVADGVGGAPGGREAAIQAIQSLESLGTLAGQAEPPLRSAIIDAIERANAELLTLGRGQATTIAAAEVTRGLLRSYHVGDTEMLVVGQRGKIKQRIVPHSPTGFAVEAGMLHERDAMQHEQRHILLNIVGSQAMRIEVGTPLKLDALDTLLIASDGLFDNLYVREIVAVVRCGPLPTAADKLVALANVRMATPGQSSPSKPDDLTIALFRQRAPQRKSKKRAARPDS
jgi:serine/threonine protein phosphatase PrpC